jgi:TRAP-type C4-dicarboxylate transport system substrate-binding protein
MRQGLNGTVAHLMTALLSTTAFAGAASAEKWDMPLAYPATNFHSETAAAFAQCVGEGTNGDLEIITHPNGSLFKGNDIKRAVQTGQAPIGERLISAHQNEDPLFGIDSIPFLATSFEDAERLWDVAQPALEETLAEQNLVYLYSVPWPPQGLYFKKAINSVDDMKGIKFRSYNTATARLAELAGMLPVQIEAAELSQALATGVAESFISSGATGYDSKVWEQLTDFYEVDAWLPRNIIFANSDAWEGLSEETKQVVRDCASKAEQEGLQRSREYTEFTLNGLREGGMTVHEPSEQLRSELREIGETMTNEWLENAGEEGRAIVEAYRKQ